MNDNKKLGEYILRCRIEGFFDVKELQTLRKIESRLQGHPDMNKIPGVDMTTGSLGQGLSAANGVAIAGNISTGASNDNAQKLLITTKI